MKGDNTCKCQVQWQSMNIFLAQSMCQELLLSARDIAMERGRQGVCPGGDSVYQDKTADKHTSQ